MVFPRSAALRASTFARYIRSARPVRSAELQPWQRMVQRRTYASAHSSSGPSVQSDMPWLIGAIAATAGGLYVVVNQDTSHGEGHGGHGEHHDEGHKLEAPAAEEAKEEKKEEPAPKEEEVKEPEEEKGEAPKEEKEEGESKKPSDTDKPDTQKEPAGPNEQSGKQDATYSNQDTRQPLAQDVDSSDDKSKKGEGVAETAKVEGTVSTERPPAENKEERGKREADKNA